MSYYIYAYLDPRKPGSFNYGNWTFDFEPFYIGKGSGQRYKVHLENRHLKHNSPKNQKIKKLIKSGMLPVIKMVQENITIEQQAFELEINLIAAIGRKDQGKGPLLNLYDGGHGSSKSQETRKKISETKKKQYAEGMVHPMLGRTHAPEVKLKMSQQRKGKKFSQQYKDNLKKVRCEKKCCFTKHWLVISPTSEETVVFGLGEFCRNNSLSQSHMFNVAKGQRKHHKGWKCQILSDT